MLNLQNSNFLSNEEIKRFAPSVFTSRASSNVSEHYTHIPTSQVIEDMSVLGWGVVDVKEVKARKNIGFQKHLVVFRNNDLHINGEDGDTVFPQILLTNSHDGKNSFTFTAGLFRLVCENGLVVSSTTFSDIKIRHLGYSFEELKNKIYGIIEQLPLTIEAMNKLKQTQLDDSQIKEIAQKAVSIRFNEDEIENLNVDIDNLIQPTRKEDENKDLWSVFNVLQEKIINGDFNYTLGFKVRKARKIKNFNQDLKINQELFNLVLEYAN
jgi:hypothetical protein